MSARRHSDHEILRTSFKNGQNGSDPSQLVLVSLVSLKVLLHEKVPKNTTTRTLCLVDDAFMEQNDESQKNDSHPKSDGQVHSGIHASLQKVLCVMTNAASQAGLCNVKTHAPSMHLVYHAL